MDQKQKVLMEILKSEYWETFFCCSYYTLRWKPTNSTFWEGRGDVFPLSGGDLCGGIVDDLGNGNDRHDVNDNVYDRRVCHSISGLHPDQDYIFQVDKFYHK